MNNHHLKASRANKYLSDLKEYFVELDSQCTFEEDHNESVSQNMAMEINQDAPFLQGPSRDMVQDGVESGSSNNDGDSDEQVDEDSQTQSDQDDSGDESGDGYDDDAKPAKRGAAPKKKNPKGQAAKLEPCEERGGSGSIQINFI